MIQLGKRWSTGTEAPKLPADYLDYIARQENLPSNQTAAFKAGSWTLTYLEGVAQLRHDSGLSYPEQNSESDYDYS